MGADRAHFLGNHNLALFIVVHKVRASSLATKKEFGVANVVDHYLGKKIGQTHLNWVSHSS